MSESERTAETAHCRWDMKAWFWVLLCAAGIYGVAPLARGIQEYIYATLGSAFFTYFVLTAIVSTVAFVLYLFIYKLEIRGPGRYLWIAASAGLYVYFTFQLREHPEEAVHLLEYALLSLLVFRALSRTVQDKTIYVSCLLMVALFGLLDESIQWLLPSRVWDYKDVAVNVLGGALSILALGKGVKPRIIGSPVQRHSLTILAALVSVNLLSFGLCLSNTPDAVNKYAAIIKPLSWLKQEEPMTEYGYKHWLPDNGVVFSRMTLQELKTNDAAGWTVNEDQLSEGLSRGERLDTLKKVYTPYTNRFLYEFLVHVIRRDRELHDFTKTKDPETRLTAFKENQIVENYFSNTLIQSGLAWTGREFAIIGDTTSMAGEDYSSKTGKLITSFTLREVWYFIVIFLGVMWGVVGMFKRRLS